MPGRGATRKDWRVIPSHRIDKVFSGSIPEIYETHLVPLIFESYALDLAERVNVEPVSKVLEVAAGTGVATRALVDTLGPGVSIVATDLNQAMLDHAASVRADENVDWRQADAIALPFEEETFDAVVCQFGVMFYPDRAKAYAEALRVLKPGGRFLFSTWDHIGVNEFADTVTGSLAGVFPDDPPMFLARTPHGYSDTGEIALDLRKACFAASPDVVTIAARSMASDPSIPAIAYCEGTPLRNEIESRDNSLLKHATDVATAAISQRFGSGAVDGKMQAHVVSIRRS
jgi:SAM-dependent methyltransferase